MKKVLLGLACGALTALCVQGYAMANAGAGGINGHDRNVEKAGDAAEKEARTQAKADGLNAKDTKAAADAARAEAEAGVERSETPMGNWINTGN